MILNGVWYKKATLYDLSYCLNKNNCLNYTINGNGSIDNLERLLHTIFWLKDCIIFSDEALNHNIKGAYLINSHRLFHMTKLARHIHLTRKLIKIFIN